MGGGGRSEKITILRFGPFVYTKELRPCIYGLEADIIKVTEVFARIILDTIKIYDANFNDDVLQTKNKFILKRGEWSNSSSKRTLDDPFKQII